MCCFETPSLRGRGVGEIQGGQKQLRSREHTKLRVYSCITVLFPTGTTVNPLSSHPVPFYFLPFSKSYIFAAIQLCERAT